MAAGLHGSISVNITNSDFISNSAIYIGRVLSASGDFSNIIITDSEFINNSANYSGVLELSNAEYSNITTTDSEFANNSANWNGGVLSMSGGDYSTTIINSEFTKNSAWSGGVLCITAFSVTSNITISITTSNFTNNITNCYCGGVLFFVGTMSPSITITDSEFTGNRAQEFGGTVAAEFIRAESTTITISYSNFTNNSTKHGEIVYQSRAYDSKSHIGIMASIFVNNKAHVAGDVLRSENTNVNVTQSTFLDNKASDGGTMYIAGGTVTIYDSQFHHNVAIVGGVLWTQDANNIVI